MTSCPAYYRSADLYLSASHSDGSSVSLMEALACGRPVLVSDIPGNREWLENSPAGWLFTDGDEDALADGILQACRSARSWSLGRNRCPQPGRTARGLGKNFQKLLGAYEMAVGRSNEVRMTAGGVMVKNPS